MPVFSSVSLLLLWFAAGLLVRSIQAGADAEDFAHPGHVRATSKDGPNEPCGVRSGGRRGRTLWRAIRPFGSSTLRVARIADRRNTGWSTSRERSRESLNSGLGADTSQERPRGVSGTEAMRKLLRTPLRRGSQKPLGGISIYCLYFWTSRGFFEVACAPVNAIAYFSDPPHHRRRTGAPAMGLRLGVDHSPCYRGRRFGLG